MAVSRNSSKEDQNFDFEIMSNELKLPDIKKKVSSNPTKGEIGTGSYKRKSMSTNSRNSNMGNEIKNLVDSMVASGEITPQQDVKRLVDDSFGESIENSPQDSGFDPTGEPISFRGEKPVIPNIYGFSSINLHRPDGSIEVIHENSDPNMEFSQCQESSGSELSV